MTDPKTLPEVQHLFMYKQPCGVISMKGEFLSLLLYVLSPVLGIFIEWISLRLIGDLKSQVNGTIVLQI